jgi:oxygen-independent coproporphyrinogen-3 oxidase
VGRKEARAGYVAAVIREVASMARDRRYAGRPVASVYFGGGTPSLLQAERVGQVLRAARDSFPIAAGAEVSLESNPDGLEPSALAAFRAAGLNRLTLGWQALDDARLKTLGRTNRCSDNLAAFRDARAAGFENIAVDLMFGTPGETLESWTRELEETADLAPEHVSAYELTVEEGTAFDARQRSGTLPLPDEEARAAMFERTDDVLARAGIRRYEISNFAKPGRECRHNRDGWQSGDLLGVGASAASHVANSRWSNVADLDEYVTRIESGVPAALSESVEALDETTWAAEDLYLGLRLLDGIDADARLARVPEPGRARLVHALSRGTGEGLLAREDRRVRLTRRGLLFADAVFEELLTRP